jgi:hypothetical protein
MIRTVSILVVLACPAFAGDPRERSGYCDRIARQARFESWRPVVLRRCERAEVLRREVEATAQRAR